MLEDLLEYEAPYWQRAASAAGLPGGAALVKQVLAASSLLGAASVAEAADVMARVPSLADRPNEQRVRWAQWLEHLVPRALMGGSACFSRTCWPKRMSSASWLPILT